MELPTELLARLKGYALKPVRAGESGASVWRCTSAEGQRRYLKAAALDAELHLDHEAARLRWMMERALPVPAVREDGWVGRVEYLLLDEVPGAPASDPRWRARAREVASALGHALARLHAASVAECPFDERIARGIEEARVRVERGLVREDAFDDVRVGFSAAELFTQLLARVPGSEDLVVTHGDFGFPNIILDYREDGSVTVTGIIDCGRMGVADRYRDLALVVRSLKDSGSQTLGPFLDAYGLSHLDEEKLDFYTLLDEFF